MTKTIKTTSLVLVAALVAISFMAMTTGSALASEHECKLKANVSSEELTTLSYTGANSGDNLTSAQPVEMHADGKPDDSKGGALVCLYSSVKQVTTIVKIIIFVVAALLFMVAAAMYATAGDNTDQQTKAKKFITSGVIGIVIALIAHFIPNLIRTFL